jgi:hypothetical protein
MRLIPASDPVPPPVDPESAGYARAVSFNLNPQQGSSILGPHPATAPPPRPAPTVWQADAAGFAAPTAAPPAHAQGYAGPIVTIEPLPTAPPAHAGMPASTALRPPPPAEPPAALPLTPLALVTRAFDSAAMLLGPPGEWLTSPAGKDLLGYCGLLMIAGSAAWGVIDWLGWNW